MIKSLVQAKQCKRLMKIELTLSRELALDLFTLTQPRIGKKSSLSSL
jgi:hypothetical protein